MSGWSRLYFSIDNGNTWTKVNDFLPNSYTISSFVFGSDSTVYAGTTSVNNRTFGVIKSTDTYDNWTQVGLTNYSVNSLAINSNGHIIAGTTDGVFRSTNNGDDWTQIGLSGKNVNRITVDSNGSIIAGTFYGDGVFFSDDNGESWIGINAGLTSPFTTRSLAINSNDFAFIGTFSDGIYRSVHPTTE